MTTIATDKGKVLVIDDEEIIRTSCKKILTPEGYTVETAESGREGLKKLRKGHFDLVLTDLKMPDTDGIGVLKGVKESQPDTEVIIVTGYGTVSTALEALRHGAYDYLEKPFTPDQLLNVVGRCLERKHLLMENLRLRREIPSHYSMENIIGVSASMQKVFHLIATVSATGTTILITGESGTGKELAARAIHYNSPRRDEPFVVVDCGTIPDNLIESELFGHTKGSFTGATESRRGLVEVAEKGTLFLDEIGNLNMPVQAKLLRVLQEKEFRPVGGRDPVRADVRIIAATNRDLVSMVKEGTFREDLFYRLNIFPIRLPSLKERKEDIPALAGHFLSKYSKESGRNVSYISAEAMKRLILYDWPGNVRELENVIHRAVILCRGRNLRPEQIILTEQKDRHIPRTSEELKEMKKELRSRSVEEIERAFLVEALDRNKWNITKAADDVGMQRTNFHALVKRHRITRAKD